MKAVLRPTGLILVALFGVVLAAAAQDEAPRDSLVLQDAAANLQRDGKFEQALVQWKQLIEKYPGVPATRLWRHNLGVCQEKVGDHAAAMKAFELVTQDAPSDFSLAPESLLHLGYNQWMLGKSAAASPEQADQSKQLGAAAAKTFATLLEKFPQSKLADQAIYFSGEALITAGQLDAAIAAFDRLIVEHPQSKLWPDAVYALGTCHEERGAFDKALVNYERFLEKHPQATQADEVRFRKAETLQLIGFAEEKAGDSTAARGRYDQAEKLYAELAKSKEFDGAPQAAFQRAVVLSRAGKFGDAAAAYVQFAADFPESESAQSARIEAGENYFRANDLAAAEKQLAAALKKDPQSIAAAHWLCKIHLASKRPQDAWDLADRTLKQIDDKSVDAVPLMMDRADAACAIPEKLADSIALHLAIVDQHPKHPLAAQALYNAGFSALATQNPARAIELAERFYAAYPQDAFVVDVREVHAEAALQQQQWDVAEKIYRQLVADHPQHAKAQNWQIGLTQSLVLAGKNDEAVKVASPLADQTTGKSQAEVLFQVGTAQFQAKEYEKAAATLSRALAADPKWSRAEEVAFLAARAEYRAGNAEKAIRMAEKCLADYPQGKIRDQILYRLGEFHFDAGHFDDAAKFYSQVIDQAPSSVYLPSALYGRGWSELRRNKPQEAIANFNELLEKFPKHSLANDALLARGMAHRRAGSAQEAIADLDRFLATQPPKSEQLEATYERALIEVDQKNYDAVIDRFQALQKLANDPAEVEKWGDKCLYEMAWAFKSKGSAEKAIEQFSQLIESYPQSPLAAEAQFHLGEAAYEASNFDDAIVRYTGAKSGGKDDAELAEKAAYKLAWAHFKKQDYAAAEKAFRQQVADFPNGAFKADGLFMISESLFRQKQHVAAVTAYKAALPEVQASKSVRDDVKLLTLLHGSQSANEAKQYDDAVAFLKPILDADTPPESYAAEAWFEYGAALKGQGKTDEAIAAWSKAQSSFDKTGIRARCMIGEAHFENKKFKDAINEFTLAVYGYGGREAHESVKPWQAFAAYELARCHLVQIASAGADDRPRLIQEAKTWFNYLVEHYPNDKLATEAKNQIAKLDKM